MNKSLLSFLFSSVIPLSGMQTGEGQQGNDKNLRLPLQYNNQQSLTELLLKLDRKTQFKQYLISISDFNDKINFSIKTE